MGERLRLEGHEAPVWLQAVRTIVFIFLNFFFPFRFLVVSCCLAVVMYCRLVRGAITTKLQAQLFI